MPTSLGSASESWDKLKLVNDRIRGKILAKSPTTHSQYNDKACLQKNPIASIEIPISFFIDWDEKISLQAELRQRPPTYVELLNFSLARTSMFSVVTDTDLEGRLKKVVSKVRGGYKTLKGANKMKFKRSRIRKFMLFESDVCFHPQPQQYSVITIPGRLGCTIT